MSICEINIVNYAARLRTGVMERGQKSELTDVSIHPVSHGKEVRA